MAQVAIWHPGEMGAAVGRVLRSRGVTVAAFVEGRGDRTRRNAVAAGFTLASSLEKSVEDCELVFSLVWPGSALDVAKQFVEACKATGQRPIYLDANSASPDTKRAIADLVNDAGCRCIDGAMTSQSTRITTKGKLLLSGPVNDCVLDLLSGLNATVVGEAVGDAAMINMCRGIFIKGLNALFLETFGAAAAASKQGEVIDLLTHYYPHTMETIQRILPTYPRHVSRRAQEMAEAAHWKKKMGLHADIVHGMENAFLRLEESEISKDRSWTFDELAEELAKRVKDWG